MARLGRAYTIQPPIEIGEVRMLSRADLHVLAERRGPPAIQTMRDSHHAVARAIAAGLGNAEVAQLTGYSYNRIAMLRQDPAFKDLVAHKRAMIDAEFASAGDPVIDYLKGNALKAAAMLSDKLDDAMEKGEFLPTRDLVSIQDLGFDRTGYGKVNKNVNVNVDFAAHLEAARKRSASAREARVVEGRAASHASGPQSLPVGAPSAPRDRPAVPSIARRF